MQELTQLVALDLMYNPIDSLGLLAGLAAPEHRVLVIQSNAQPLADLTPLEDLASLTALTLSGCHVSDLDGLDGLIGLETLLLSHNDIVSGNDNLAEIGALPSLVTLYLDENQIANPCLQAQSGCVALRPDVRAAGGDRLAACLPQEDTRIALGYATA